MNIKSMIEAAGWPRIIIALFLLFLFLVAPLVDVKISTSVSDTIVRFGRNGVMVLAMVPMIRSGCGLNFGLPLGIIGGILGILISVELELTGMSGFLTALVLGVGFGAVLGWGYGILLNMVKGDEMMIATYVGFSSVAFMSMAWLMLPFKSKAMIWSFGGSGLRTTISMDNYWTNILSDFLSFRFFGQIFPTGMILFFAFMCFLVWLFFRTQTGQAMSAVGQNPDFARASGVNVDKMRIQSVILSTMIGAVGIIVYAQSYGFVQLYLAPLFMAFPAVAAVLLGGASLGRVSIVHVLVGTFLFQGILTMTPSVINSAMSMDISEVIRLIVSNGMIIYALTRRVKEVR
ncbi:ABC transporter [Deltaproteobacteria bacterium Smac51]|nr:ABC transporter [Deltaproteobacteria bacterium Smac51]